MGDIDTGLVDKIVHEVKSQGVFDLFRKDSMADVDTKPSYQNLRQRTENAVKKFLSEQEWTPETNKNQLRERLRKHIAESGFLSVGVERIVDQVVDPKIATVFKPKIEEIAYNCLGVPQPPRSKYEPPPPLLHPFPPLPMSAPPLRVDTVANASLLPTDLEQVSPDSDKATEKLEQLEDMDMDIDDDDRIEDEDESPPFEPLFKCESREKEISPSDSQSKGDMAAPSSPKVAISVLPASAVTDVASNNESNETCVENTVSEKIEEPHSVRTPEGDSEKEASCSLDAAASQESQLSQVSSDSRISIASHEFRAKCANPKSVELEKDAVNISEEAQMPKFSENSSEDNGDPNGVQLHFDIKKDEIKFEGTERKVGLLEATQKDSFDAEPSDVSATTTTERNDDVATRPEHSFSSSLEDTDSTPLCIAEKSIESTALSEQKPLSMTTVSSSELAIDVSSSSHRRDKVRHSSTSSSSRSQHKKPSTSKDKPQSNEKESSKHGDSEQGRDKERLSREKISSTRSPKHSSSSRKDSQSPTSKQQKASDAVSKNTVSYSSNSSSSRSDFAKSERKRPYSERKSHSSTTRDKSSSGGGNDSLKPSEQKASLHDDHNEPKTKLKRRKSTDSNDEDRGSGANGPGTPTSKTASPTTRPNESENQTKSYNSEAKDSNSQNIQGAQLQLHQQESMVVVSNDILKNPQTELIALEASSSAKNVEIVSSAPQARPTNEIDDDNTEKQSTSSVMRPLNQKTGIEETDVEIISDDDDLEFFDNGRRRLDSRLSDIDFVLDTLTMIINGMESSQLNAIDVQLSNTTTSASDFKNEHTDGSSTSDECPPKQIKTGNKASPTPSETSVNSKENEMFDKNLSVNSKKSPKERRNNNNNAATNKISQQRYSSEDLYKPRPVLSQRSRRRGLDSLI